MNDTEDTSWQNLIAISAPAFPGAIDEAPPYGFTTRILAQLGAETRQRELMERIGLRALLASMTILMVTAAFALGLNHGERSDFEPGLSGILQAADVPLS